MEKMMNRQKKIDLTREMSANKKQKNKQSDGPGRGKKRSIEESNIEDDEIFGDIELINVGESRADSTRRGYSAAMKHFNEFLIYSRKTSNFSVNDLQPEEITRELLGVFVDYLFKVVEIRTVGTVHEYLSSVKVSCSRIHPLVKSQLDDGEWYRVLRRNVRSMYIKRCVETGMSCYKM